MSKLSVLIIEDEENICNFIKTSLRPQGYKITIAATAAEGLSIVNSGGCDLVLLDLGLPDADGLEIIREVRSWSSLPIIVISARTREQDKVHALDAGADDYITKPFGTAELMARIRAMCRRPRQWESSQIIRLGDVVFDREQKTLEKEGQSCTLSRRESELMEMLLKNPGQILPRGLLLSRVWGPEAEVEEGNLDNYIHFLRRRLRSVGSTLEIRTVRGVGYQLEVPHV